MMMIFESYILYRIALSIMATSKERLKALNSSCVTCIKLIKISQSSCHCAETSTRRSCGWF